MNKFAVVGAGMAGLFAAAVLREDCDFVLEAQKDLPNNHPSLLRFRSSIVGDALNIPFKPVSVIKTVISLGNPVADAIAYSIKTNGEARLRSVLSAEGKVETRYIAPTDFIKKLASKVQAPIQFNAKWTGSYNQPVISTIPMPTLMELLDYEQRPDFKSTSGVSIRIKLRNTDLCATIYLPDPMELAYRVSITHDQLIVEISDLPSANKSLQMENLDRHPIEMRRFIARMLKLFGIPESFMIGTPEVKQQRYAKILPIDDDARKRFILWASETHNIYSFGRFATWRPGLLMDDLVNDLRVIQYLANGGSSYNARKEAKRA